MYSLSRKPKLGLIGFGEVGSIFATDLLKTNAFSSVSAWDQLFQSATKSQHIKRCHELNIAPTSGCEQLIHNSDLIVSAVTAASTLSVAKEAARHMTRGQVFLDLNSASPAVKQQCGAVINHAGGIYVEAGVMTSVPPYRITVPILLGGPQAAKLSLFLNTLGMSTQVASKRLGIASAIKMSRSVMIKGLEGLVIESFTTARQYGVEEQVLASLTETFAHINWQQQGSYFFSRVAQHGKRRAEEMREAAKTVAQAGIEPLMTTAIAVKHQRVADYARAGLFERLPHNTPWQVYADTMLRSDKTNGKLKAKSTK